MRFFPLAPVCLLALAAPARAGVLETAFQVDVPGTAPLTLSIPFQAPQEILRSQRPLRLAPLPLKLREQDGAPVWQARNAAIRLARPEDGLAFDATLFGQVEQRLNEAGWKGKIDILQAPFAGKPVSSRKEWDGFWARVFDGEGVPRPRAEPSFSEAPARAAALLSRVGVDRPEERMFVASERLKEVGRVITAPVMSHSGRKSLVHAEILSVLMGVKPAAYVHWAEVVAPDKPIFLREWVIEALRRVSPDVVVLAGEKFFFVADMPSLARALRQARGRIPLDLRELMKAESVGKVFTASLRQQGPVSAAEHAVWGVAMGHPIEDAAYFCLTLSRREPDNSIRIQSPFDRSRFSWVTADPARPHTVRRMVLYDTALSLAEDYLSRLLLGKPSGL